MIAVKRGPRLQGKCITASRFREGIRPTACRASFGKKAAYCAGVPQRSMALVTRVLCTSTKTPTAASTREISSTARQAIKKLLSAPPYCLESQRP